MRTSQTRGLNHHHHISCCGRKHTPAPAHHWVISLLGHGYATLWVALRRNYKTIPATQIQHVKSTNLSSVWLRRWAWRCTMTTCRRKETLLSLSWASQTGMASRSLWPAGQIIRLFGSGNYTISRIYNGLTLTNGLSNTAVETSSTPWDGRCGSQPTPSSSDTPRSVAVTVIHHWNVSTPKCTVCTGGGIHREWEILEDNHVLIDIKSTLTVSDTLVPLIFIFDGTPPFNCTGYRKEWPAYMTIGNRTSKIHPMPSTHSVVIVALLLIPIKNCNIAEKQQDKQWHTNREVLNEALRPVLKALTITHSPSTESRYDNVLCEDGYFRRCKPVLEAWLADCPKYCDLHHLEGTVHLRCECPINELEHSVHPDKQHPQWDYNLYGKLNAASTNTADTELLLCHVHQGFNVFWNIPCIVRALMKPHLFDTMQIGMLDHLQQWIFHCMKMHECLDK